MIETPKRCPHCGTMDKRKFRIKVYTNGNLKEFEAKCDCGYERKLPGREYENH